MGHLKPYCYLYTCLEKLLLFGLLALASGGEPNNTLITLNFNIYKGELVCEFS